MVTDAQTNFLYLPDTLPGRHKQLYTDLQQTLDDAGIPHALLPHTKDIWASDYMPVQVEKDDFQLFQYNPDYLRNTVKWRKTITDADKVCAAIGLPVEKTGIILDGGNISRGHDAVILCDKLFSENPQMGEKELIRQLENIFRVSRIIIIPTHPFDITGHSDGVLRWYDNHTVLINDYRQDPTGYGLHLRMALHNAGIDCISIPYNPHHNETDDDATGEYINFLWMKQAIIVPVFGMEEDEQAIRSMEQLFPGKKITGIPAVDLAKTGGVLNCISWNILK